MSECNDSIGRLCRFLGEERSAINKAAPLLSSLSQFCADFDGAVVDNMSIQRTKVGSKSSMTRHSPHRQQRSIGGRSIIGDISNTNN